MLNSLPFTLPSLHKAYTDGVSVLDILTEINRRIDAVNDEGIFISRFSNEDLIKTVSNLGAFDPEKKSLWGIPCVVKDNIDVAGLPTTAGCPAFAYSPTNNATAVQYLIDAGAIVIGKTNLDQFATGLVGVRTPYPVPKNAVDPSIVPGGSSAGSAVAVSHGFVCFSLGTDTAGSGRVPAALNNIIGLKPTLGAVSNTGVVPACKTLDTISIFALTTSDASNVLSVMAHYDPQDSFSRVLITGRPIKIPTSLTIAIPDEASLIFDEDSQRDSFNQAIFALEEMGATLIRVDFTPFFAASKLLYEGPWIAERHAAIGSFIAESPEHVVPVTRNLIEKSLNFFATDAYKGQYKLAELKQDVAPVFAACDLLCVPSIPGFCSLVDIIQEPLAANARLGTYTNFVNLMDLCGIAIPVATRNDDRPGGVTLIALAGEDQYISGIADALHRKANVKLGATNWTIGTENNSLPLVTNTEMTIAAVGAHMSGLPLNYQLTDLGARYLFTTKTVATYKLVRLAGKSPLRPGLIREANGAAIEVEVWALPLANVGAFITQIPAPLGMGKVQLNDGTETLGFICEAIGEVGAEDISEFGGWRRYLASQS